MKKGELIAKLPEIDDIQTYYVENIKRLPEKYKDLEEIQTFELKLSKKLDDLTRSLKERFK